MAVPCCRLPEKRLRKAMLAARGKARNARRFRMEDGRAGAHDGRREQQQAEVDATASITVPISVKHIPTASAYGMGRDRYTAR